MVVVGVGSAMAITALAEDAHYRFVNIPHFYLDSYEYRDYDSSSQIKVQFWRIQTDTEIPYQDKEVTYDGSSFICSDYDDEEKRTAFDNGSITPNTPLSDSYKAKKVYVYVNKCAGFYDEDDEYHDYDLIACMGSTTLGALLDAYGIDESTNIRYESISDIENHLRSITLNDADKDDTSALAEESYFYYGSWYFYIGDDKPFPSYLNWDDDWQSTLSDYASVKDFYYDDEPARTYTAAYTRYDPFDPDTYRKLDGEDTPYSETTLVKSTTGRFWFSQNAVTLPIPKSQAYKTYVRLLVDDVETKYESIDFDNTYADRSGMNFASMDTSIKVFAVSDKLTPTEADGYMRYCTPLAVRIKYDYADAHAAFKYSKNEKPNDANAQAAIGERYSNDDDWDDTYISTYNWHGVNPEMDSLSEFFGRGVYLAGDASEQNYYDNKAPMYSNDGDDETPDEDREYLPVMGWMMEENENKKWGFGYNTEDTGDDQVQISIGEMFYSMSKPTGTYDNYDTDKVEIARQNAVGKFTFNNQSGFYEYTFLVEPDLPVVTYKAVYLDADGNVVKDDGVERAVDLSDEKYGDKYKTKSYGSGTTVTVEDKLTASDFPGYTLFNGWEIDTDSLPDGKTVNDIAGRVYEQKKDKDGNLIEGEYTDNVKSFSMPSFGVVLRGELVPRVYTLTYKTNKEQYGLSVEPSKPQNSLKKDAVTQTFTIADCTLYKNQEPIHGNPDNPDQITGWTDYYLYTFPSRTCTAQDGEGNDLYYLRGWAKESDSTTETTTVKLTDLTKTDYEVYAIWENTVTYQPGKANGTNVPGTDVVDKTVTNSTHTVRSSCPFTAPEKFHFKGWELVSPTGKDYPGKFETQGSSNLIASGNQITVKDNVTYKAIWEGDKHAVTYTLTGDNQPSVTLPATAQIPYTDDYTVAGKLTATGYTFDGWDVKTGDVPDADITKDADGNAKSFKMPNNAVTLQGTFTENEYTLQYVENAPAGATVSNMPAQLTVSPILYTALKDDDYTLSDKVPTAPGYTFAGWKINETEDVIQAGNTIAFGYFDNDGKTATATAQWTLNVYKLEYKTGDVNAEMPADASNLTYAQVGGGEYTLSDTVPAAKGYTFEGWKLNVTEGNKPKGAAIPYENFDNSTFTATATAQWTENEYTLVYDTGDVTAAAGTMPEPITDSGILYTTVKDGNYTLSAAEPSAPGYTFEGWKLNVTDGNKRASDKVPFENFDNDGKTATATAQWTENKYTVTYQHNTEGTSLTDKVFDDLTYGSSHTVWDNTGESAFIYAGHTFDGWELVSPASGYAVTGTITVNDNVTYKAKWTVNSYTLQYDKGIVSALSASSPALPGTRDDIIWADFRANGVTVEQTKLQADGYTFLGWKITNTSSDPHVEKTYSADDFGKATFDGTVQEALFNSERVATAVAQWAENTYELVYDVNAPTGATVKSSTVPATESKTYTELTGGRLQPAPGGIVPAVKSYTFDGWKIKEDAAVTFDKDNSGNATLSFDKFVQVDDTTTYRATAQAQWTLVENPVTYTLTKPDGATDITYTAPGEETHAYETDVDVKSVPVAGTVYDSEKYSFEGWTTTDVTVSDGRFIMPENPVTFEGVFTYNEYTVTYQISGTVPDGVTLQQYPAGTSFHKGDSVTMLNKDIGDVDGYTFSGWSPYADDFTMPGRNVIITGSFGIGSYPVIYQDEDGNELSRESVTYDTLYTVQPAGNMPDPVTGYEKADWVVAEGGVSYDSNRQFTMPGHPVILRASYTPLYQVKYQLQGKQSDITYNPADTNWYREHANVSRFADPASPDDYDAMKYTFEWISAKGETSGDNVTVGADGTFTMPDENVVILGKFTENPKYTVTYTITSTTPDASEYELVQDSNTYYAGQPVTLLNKGLRVEGYDFSGWSPYADDFAMPDGDLELTAYFTAHTPSVIYLDVNGAPFTTPDALKSTPHDYHTTVEMASASLIPDIEGKTKATEWKLVDGIDASEIHDRTFSMPDNDVTFQATYTDNKYTVTYQPNVPGGSQDNKVYENISYGSSHTVWDNTGDGAFTHYGHTFAGWELVSPATGYATSGTITVNDDVTYQATWTALLYTLQYDKGIVSALSASSPALPAKDDTITLAKLRDGDVNISTTKPQADGYTFTGWKITNTSSDPNVEKTYSADDFGKTTFDGTVYEALFNDSRIATAVAQWEEIPAPVTYTVTYTAGGGTGDDQKDENLSAGAAYSVWDNTATGGKTPFTNGDKSFDGWDLVTPSSGYATSGSITVNDNITYRAKWKDPAPVTYTLIYDDNHASYEVAFDEGYTNKITGITGIPSSVTTLTAAELEAGYTLAASGPDATNYSFDGWSDEDNKAYDKPDRKTEVTLADFGTGTTLTVYAKWKAKVTVTYFCGIEEGDELWDNPNFVQTQEFTKLDLYTLNGYKIKHNSELNPPFEFPGYDIRTWTVVEGQNLIRIDRLPDPTSGGSAQTVRSGAPAAVTTLTPGTIATFYGSVTLKAEWVPISSGTELTVTYNANGGTPETAVPVDSNKYAANDTPTVLAKGDSLKKDGAEFVEWNTSANGSGKGYQVGQQLDPMTANVTLYAIWKPDVAFIVEYDGNGHTAGTVPTDNSRYAAGSTAAVKSKEDLERTGCTFKEWNTQPNGSGTGYKGDGTDTIQINGNVKLYAIWVDPNGNIVSPGTGESNLPMLIACNMALLSMLAGGLVLTKRKKAEMQQTVC